MKKRWMVTLEILTLVALCGFLGYNFYSGGPSKPTDGIDIKVQFAGARDGTNLHKNEQGELRFRVVMKDGTVRELTETQFSKELYEEGRSRRWWEVYLNISTPEGLAWVLVGFLGQFLFTGRMVVQWLASEKEKRSVVPPAFWWMSLTGASMLLVYFIWRRDMVGILGQSFGWFIYVRNLKMIYAKAKPTVKTIDTAAQKVPG